MKKKLLTFEIPEDPDRVPEWLEYHLMGLDLHQLVTELQVMGGATAPTAPLKDVLGDQCQEVLQTGLRSLTRTQLGQLLNEPQLLVELQGLVLNEGGKYWNTVPPSDEVANNTKKTWEKLQATIAQEAPKTNPSTAVHIPSWKGKTMPKPTNPDWRNTDAKPNETADARSWKAKEAAAAGPKLPSRRFLRRGIVVTLLLGLAVTIGVLLTFLKGTRPACVVLVGSGYENNLLLPPNIYGWNGGLNLLKNISDEEETALMTWFRQQFGQKSGIRRTRPVALAEHSWTDTWKEIASRIKDGDPKEQVILYFSAHGYADANEAYLLRDVADIKSSEDFNASRVPFSELLASLKNVPSEKRILLVLDVCHVESHWPIGMLRNDFVERVQKKYAKDINAMENLAVICSTSPGQRSWVSEEQQKSIFADYMARGLQGEGRAPEERITAEGLFEYVRKNVNEWAKINRAREQVPIRIGDADPELANGAKPAAKDDAPKEDPTILKKEEAPKVDSGSKFNPAEMESAWKAWMVLKRDYAPQVYSPHYWRLYQEMLLRYEQLKVAGDPTGKADALKQKLDLLESQIKTDKGLDKAFDCLGNSFPLARALGFHPKGEVSAKEMQAALDQWKKIPHDRQKTPAALKIFTSKSELERRYWQTRLSRLFLTKQLKEPDFDRAGVSQVMKIAEDLDVPQRAAEVHLVKMLRDADAALDKQPDLIKLAVRVRMLAEEAALGAPGEADASELYAEAIFKRMQKDIENADALRRAGEDFLVGNPNAQVAARDKLKLAQESYQKILAKAEQTRKAFALRDDLAAELPFFDASLASLPPASDELIDEIKMMRDKAESLGESHAILTKFLDKGEGALPKLKPIEDDLKYVREQYSGMAGTLRGLGAKLQKNWHALNGVLSVPPALATEKDVEVRIELLDLRRKTSIELNAPEHPDPQKDKLVDTVEAQRKLLRSYLKVQEDQTRVAEPTNVDDSAREFFLGQFKTAADESGKAEKEAALQSAAGCSRVLLGYLADQLIDHRRDRINPAKRLRHLRTYQMLIGLAQRTLEDHWFDPGAKDDVTYYGPAATAFLGSAAKILVPTDPKMVKERDELERRLARSGLNVLGNPNRYWTTEMSFPLKSTVEAESDVPHGIPTVWYEVPKGKPRDRETVRDWPSHIASIVLSETEFAPTGKVPATLHAVYRGQHVTRDLIIERPPPTIIARQTPGPENVAFAVRMETRGYGAISIVLDNSGSMKYRHPKKSPKDKNENAGPNETSRYDFALKAVKKVLGSIPDGTPLSVVNFGGKTATEPVLLEPPTRWLAGRTDNLMAKLGGDLNNASPIAKAIALSMDKGFPEDFEQPMLVVVLTDGMDNCSYNRNDADDNTKSVIKELKRYAAKYPKTDVVVVCFLEKDDEDGEYKQAEKQFQRFTENGDFIQEAEGEKLGLIIENRIVRPRVVLQAGGKIAQGFDEGRPVNYLNDPVLNWLPGLKRNDYRSTIRYNPGTAFDLRMSPGHNLFAILKREDNQYILERGILAKQPEIDKNTLKAQKGDWLVSMLMNEKPFDTESRKQIIAFEKTRLETGSLRQTYPGLVWLEMETQDGKKLDTTLEWGSDMVVPAPAYGVDVANWPGGNPKLTAWFWPRPWEDLLENVKPIVNKRIPIKDYVGRPDDIIESMLWEKRQVGVMTPQGAVMKEKDCLVVRARYLDGKPVYVGLKEKNDRLRSGSEHRYYDQAGKCTAFFYDLPAALTEVDIVVLPVAPFKEAAVKVEFAPREWIAVPNIFRKDIIEALHGK